MLTLSEKIIFAALAALSFFLAYRGFRDVVAIVSRGERGYYPRFQDLSRRLGGAVTRTLSQVTVFRARPLVSFFHSFVFYGFIFYLLVNFFDGLKGYLPVSWLAGLDFGLLGDLYRLAADLLTVLILVGVIFFLLRRFAVRDRALEQNNRTLLHEKVRRNGIQRDSLIVALFILFHVGFRLLGESFLVAAEGRGDPWQPFAGALAAAIGEGGGRLLGWHVGWWGALGLILAFLPYFPRSKHLHLLAAPVNFALERRRQDGDRVPLGALEPIDFEDENREQFGVARLEDLRWPQLLDPYACIQCNRCTNVCPANQTGKALSPAAIEINKRYELNALAATFAAGGDSPREVLEFVLDEASLWACTTCGACMEVCPVACQQMIDIVDIRRDQVMMKGAFPAELNAAFRGMERAGNPWGIGQDKRLDWAEGLEVPRVEEKPDFEVLFWVGCAGAYDPAAQQTTRAMVRILEHAGVAYAVLGKRERCSGDPARRAGNEYLYYQLASENVALLDEVLLDRLDPDKRKRVVTTCPHCFNALLNDYPQLGGEYEVVHHTQLIDELMAAGRLPPLSADDRTYTYHDPCYLGRHNGVYQAPRSILEGTAARLVEMPRNRNRSFCCGAGGAQFWKEEEEGEMRVSENRFHEAEATGAEIIAAACPFCKSMLGSSEGAEREDAPRVLDIAQIVAGRLERIQATLDRADDEVAKG